MDLLILCSFVMAIRVWGRLIIGSTRNWGRGLTSLTAGNFSSVVIDNFSGGGQDIRVAGVYYDYLDRKEQTTSNRTCWGPCSSSC